MLTVARAWFLALCFCWFAAAAAADKPEPPALPAVFAQPPVLLSIEFSGNKTTKPIIMRQEMGLHVGDVATAEAVESARQAVMDLGLFKGVKAELVPTVDGVLRHVRQNTGFIEEFGSEFATLRITVDEKWYILPIPRLSLNGDGESSYGVRVKWNNIFGLNQRLSVLARQSTNAEDDRGDSTKFSVSYDYPLVVQSRFNLGLGASIERTPVEEPLLAGGETNVDESTVRAGVQLTRSLTTNTKGWEVGAGIGYWNLEFADFDDGFVADDLERGGGDAPSFELLLRNNQVQDFGYSRGGWRFSGALEQSLPLGSFNFWKLNIDGARFLQIGQRDDHRRLILRGNLGLFNGGPRNWDEYSSGGSSNNRGFEKNIDEGNLSYFVGAEYLQPIFGSKSLRGLFLIDVSQVYEEIDSLNWEPPLVSVGLGIRWRVQSFVDLEIDLALAYGLNQEGGFRGTGGSNRGD